MRARDAGPAHIWLERCPFVGRGDELASLQEAYTAVAASKAPQLIALIGDAGVGKTRLVAELWRGLSKQMPAPRKLIVGDLSERECVLRALNLPLH